jgi:NADH:quinone reductase (non-electrogenic)
MPGARRSSNLRGVEAESSAGREPGAGTHRVVIVGGGFGGLFAARMLRRAPTEVVLVDRNNHHLFQPLLYQVATGILSQGQIAPPIRGVLSRQRNVEVMLAEAQGFDLEGRTVTAMRPDGDDFEISYDSLIVAAGAGQSYFGHDEYSRWAPGMKTVNDALELRGRIFGAFEMAALEPDPELRREWLTFAVVGGGPTGVEIAGQIAELARRVLPRDFKAIDSRSARVLLFDGGKAILASFGDRLSAKGAKELDRLGVEIHTESIVSGVDRTGVEVKGSDGEAQRIPARTKVWAAGVQASPLAGLLADACGVECDRAGRIPVGDDCSLPGHPEVFAIGDMMALNELPGVAEVAMQQGIHASNTIRRRLAGKAAEPFRYRDLGSMATISRFRAVVSFRGIRVAGFLGWLMWLFVHLAFLTGFKNRFTTVLQWGMTFIGNGRNERTFTVLETIGRVAIEQAGGREFVLSLADDDDGGQAAEGRGPSVDSG